MKKKVVTVVLSMLCMAFWGGSVFSQSYVGPEKCLMCHNNSALGDATGWRTSMHANGYSAVLDDSHSMEKLNGIVADYDQNGTDDFKDGLDFNTITSAFDPYKPNAPILGYDSNNGYTITIGQVAHRVYLTYGGSGLYKQRFGVKINTSEGETQGIYISPIQFNEKTHEYVLYHPDAWYDANKAPIYTPNSTLAEAASNSKSLAKGCSGCHVTGLTLDQNTSGEWVAHGGAIDPTTLGMYTSPNIFDLDGDGTPEQINTGCERCHGPGGDHAAAPSKSNIVNPADLTTEQANNICGMCHSRGHSLPNNTFSFPFNDAALTSWSIGDLVADYYNDGGGYWGDGITSKQHHQQFYDFYQSSKPTFQFHQVRCTECHDVHNTVKHHIRQQIEEEDSQNNPITIATDPDNNTLCLACHATHGYFADITKEMVADYATNENQIAAIVMKHTHHTYDPTDQNGTSGASRCSKCHNPKMAKSAVAYDIHSHTFEPVSPEKTLKFAMPNACAVSCHNKNNFTFGVDMSGDTFTDWSEQTDKDLANELLYWYDNMWFDKKNEDDNIVNSAFVTTPPVLDGDASDPAWAGMDFATVPLANHKSVQIKSTYTGTDLYMLLKWADSTASFTRSGSWSYDGSGWVTSSGQSEDRFGIMWNISVPDSAWQQRGCMNKCHRNVDNAFPNQDNTTTEDDAFLPAGQKADMWHMKAARSLPVISAGGDNVVVDPVTHEVIGGSISMVGYVDDKYIGEYAAPPDGGRYGDAGSGSYDRNRNTAKTGPKYIEKNPVDFLDAMVLRQSEIDNGETVEVDNLSATDLQTYWAKYAALNAVVPERILHAPSGSRSDVMQAAKWENGYWVTEIKRALDTGNADDVVFTTSSSVSFGIALMDNTGGERHWTQGAALTTLNIGTTGVIAKDDGLPIKYELSQNYPNPFNPTTTIEFNLPQKSKVKLAVYTVSGQLVKVLIDGYRPAGNHKTNFNGDGLASGVYIIRMKSDAGTFTQKMTLLK